MRLSAITVALRPYLAKPWHAQPEAGSVHPGFLSEIKKKKKIKNFKNLGGKKKKPNTKNLSAPVKSLAKRVCLWKQGLGTKLWGGGGGERD